MTLCYFTYLNLIRIFRKFHCKTHFPLQPTIIEIANRRALSFREMFYMVFDSARDSISSFFRPNSKVVWGGNIMESSEKIERFFKMFPLTEHLVTSINAQPIILGAPGPVDLNPFTVTCSGTLNFGVQKSPIGFSHTFILMNDASSPAGEPIYYIVSAIMRTHELPDSNEANPNELQTPNVF